ncbi:M28 family peptidase [Treponema sp.]|uniref:M28 family peptidase n=1 Tax=Treponema sp. TaxID=166 RepID=UPI003F00156D
MGFLPDEFSEYLALDCNRSDFIQTWLKAHGVESNQIVIDEKKNILVQFGSSSYNPQFKIKTVIAHHDRVANSPGANDNSAADWQLMNWAVWLKNYPSFHNVRIFFTDGEELGWTVSNQGAFGIAKTFQRLGITNDDVYVFDACGRGEIPILSKSGLSSLASPKFKAQFSDLYKRTENILRIATDGRWMSLPVPYSDNASFIACGIPAVAITLLPADEASLYARKINSDKHLEDAVMNRESSKQKRLSENIPDFSYKEHLPYTWRLFHTKDDNIDSLTPASFKVMASILKLLAESKTPC